MFGGNEVVGDIIRIPDDDEIDKISEDLELTEEALAEGRLTWKKVGVEEFNKIAIEVTGCANATVFETAKGESLLDSFVAGIKTLVLALAEAKTLECIEGDVSVFTVGGKDEKKSAIIVSKIPSDEFIAYLNENYR
ncbi:MAG: hypothetical protein GY804_10260 [Alphaproteobacteria bacterium]|nr:hypothetical protein [Alphaproteobacteria bacterium]